MGSGTLGVQFSGTSMATPHMTGVLALMRQAHPELSAEQLKALVMGTALAIKDKTGKAYPVSAAGSGRVRAFAAATAEVLANPPALSLGEVLVDASRTIRTRFTLTNLTDKVETLTLTPQVKAGMTLTLPSKVTLKPKQTKTIDVVVKIVPASPADASEELDGFIDVGGLTGSYHVPLLAVVDRSTRLTAKDLTIHAASIATASGAAAELTLANLGHATGDALVFNLLGKDPRDQAARRNTSRNVECQLESAGWRVVTQTANGADTKLLQIAVKLYNPITSWQLCDVSVLIDGTGEGKATQELLGTNLATLSTNDEADSSTFLSALTDASQMQAIEKTFESAAAGTTPPAFESALVDAQDYTPYGHSTVAVVSADLSKVTLTPSGDLKIKVVVSGDQSPPTATTT